MLLATCGPMLLIKHLFHDVALIPSPIRCVSTDFSSFPMIRDQHRIHILDTKLISRCTDLIQ